MVALLIFSACVVAALVAGALASWSDFSTMTIPNRYSAVVAVSFFCAAGVVFFSGTDLFAPIARHLMAGAIVFIVTLAMFFLKMFGGGDSKLLSAFALWTGMAGIMPMLVVMALAGGVLGVAALAIGKWRPFSAPRAGSWIARLQEGQKRVPYGIPITIGAVAAFLQLGYLNPHRLALFVGGAGS